MEKGMTVRYIGDSYKVTLIKGKEYTIDSIDPDWGWLRIFDETDEYAFFPEDEFELID